MPENYMSVLVKATKAQLTASTEVWGGRIFRTPQLVSESKPAQYPYLVCMLAGGGMKPIHKTAWVEVLWQVVAVSNDQEQAFTAAARVSALLRDADITSNNPLDNGNADWEISTVSELDFIDVVEPVNSGFLYHAGATYRITMQAK